MEQAVESPQRQTGGPSNARPPRSTPSAEPDSLSTFGPSRELIASRAFELFQLRGGEHGHDVEDWLQAEREFADPAGEAEILTREINEPAAN